MYDLNTIIESIINGQRKQALVQLCDSVYSLEDLFERLLEEQMPEETMLMIAAIWKDPRDLIEYSCCKNEEIFNWSFISTDIIKRVTEKYLRYYRMLYQPPTPSVVNQ